MKIVISRWTLECLQKNRNELVLNYQGADIVYQ
jgi:hypothetical protein